MTRLPIGINRDSFDEFIAEAYARSLARSTVFVTTDPVDLDLVDCLGAGSLRHVEEHPAIREPVTGLLLRSNASKSRSVDEMTVSRAFRRSSAGRRKTSSNHSGTDVVTDPTLIAVSCQF